MYLAKLTVENFRRLDSVTVEFDKGLNVIVGPNNVGKTAIIESLRALLAGIDDPYPRFDQEDVHLPKGGDASGEIQFLYVFRDLSLEDEADFLPALMPAGDGTLEAQIGVAYGDIDRSGRMRPRRWCGEHQDVPLSSAILENLRSVYLPPLRDAAQGLRPSRSSQLSRLLQLLSDEPGREGISKALAELDMQLKKHRPIVDTQEAITTRHSAMLGSQLAQVLEVGLSASDFQKLAARLSLLVDAFELEQNGLGYNNLIFMAVVLSELAKNAEASYRGLIIEEPEAHLHPQLQAILLRYLSAMDYKEGERPVQVFVTSHSPNFASIADLESIACLVDVGGKVESFHPRNVAFEKGKKEKLKRYLDVTRAELFFAHRIVFVEGAAELLLVNVLALQAGYDLREHGVSLISVEGLNFDSFLPLFGNNALKIPVSVITDADPQKVSGDGGDLVPIYPDLNDDVLVSDNTAAMLAQEDGFVRIFHGVKTFEYDFALYEPNRLAMVAALKDIHPKIGASVESEVSSLVGNSEKARAIYCGMFERKQNNVQKGRFAQALAAKIEDDGPAVNVPGYIVEAIKHVCK